MVLVHMKGQVDPKRYVVPGHRMHLRRFQRPLWLQLQLVQRAVFESLQVHMNATF